jgi:3-oxoadipate enol-lactonase
VNLNHRIDGSRQSPVLALPSSLGTTMELWAPNLVGWSERFCVLRYDQRGHGGSQPPDGPYSVEELGRDFLQLLDELGIERVSFCGLSFGGATGMWLAANVPERIDRLVLACTSARFGEPGYWRERAARVREGGVEAVADSVLARWFTPRFAAERADVVERFRRLLVETPREGYAASCEAIADWDFRERLGAIRAPTHVVAAAIDPATPPEHARLLADRIPGAKLTILPDAAHLANVEQADAFSALVTEHFAAPVVEVA